MTVRRIAMRKSMEKLEKINTAPELVLERLAGKRLIFGGCNGKLRDRFVQNLVHLIEQSRADIVLHNGVEKAQAGDYVLLFGENLETDQRQRASADGIGASREEVYDHTELLTLGAELQKLAKINAGAVLFLSDTAVYGKCFGEQHARKEEELGYVSHTSKGEISVQNMRMAEHLVCRLAREEGVEAKVVRARAGLYEEDAKNVILAALWVLLGGERGEIYNLPAGKGADNESVPGQSKGASASLTMNRSAKESSPLTRTGQNAGEHSPLAPMEIVPDTGKFETIV